MTSNCQLVPCIRCGYMRQTKNKIRSLCGDCKSVLTKEEVKAWTEEKIAA